MQYITAFDFVPGHSPQEYLALATISLASFNQYHPEGVILYTTPAGKDLLGHLPRHDIILMNGTVDNFFDKEMPKMSAIKYAYAPFVYVDMDILWNGLLQLPDTEVAVQYIKDPATDEMPAWYTVQQTVLKDMDLAVNPAWKLHHMGIFYCNSSVVACSFVDYRRERLITVRGRVSYFLSLFGDGPGYDFLPGSCMEYAFNRLLSVYDLSVGEVSGSFIHYDGGSKDTLLANKEEMIRSLYGDGAQLYLDKISHAPSGYGTQNNSKIYTLIG